MAGALIHVLRLPFIESKHRITGAKMVINETIGATSMSQTDTL